MNWEMARWRVQVRFALLLNQLQPRDYMDRLSDPLPQRWARLRRSGDGLQGVYLTEVPPIMA
jgi:putative restriction endonuclease